LFGGQFENEFSFCICFLLSLFISVLGLVFCELIKLISVWHLIISLPGFLILFSWTTLAYVIFDEINFVILLPVVGPPSGLPSYVFLTYFLLAGGVAGF
jgi:hypothetical protein